MATTLGAEKKRNDLTKREEKMTNAPVQTAASEPSQHRQKRRKSNWTNFTQIQFMYLISVWKKAPQYISILS